MAGKRSHSEMEASAPPQSSEWDGPPKKRHKKKKHKTKPDSLNWIRKRARTIDRKLQRSQDNLPGDVSVKLQRELAAHSERITQADDKKQRQKMIKRYHMVRFFGTSPPPDPAAGGGRSLTASPAGQSGKRRYGWRSSCARSWRQ